MLFRNYPAIAQSYAATRLEDDGWYDREGWTITRWFKDAAGKDRPVVVGNTHDWTKDAWQAAAELWLGIGREHGLYLSAEEERNMIVLAERFVKEHKIPNAPPPDILDPEGLDPGMRAFIFMWNYKFYRDLSNYPHFLNRAQTFALPQTVQARKHFHNAIAAKIAGNRRLAIEEFEKALPAYNEILKTHETFRLDDHIAEETLDFEMGYLTLCRELYGRQWKQALATQAFLGLAASGAAPGAEALPLALTARAHLLPEVDLKGPLDDTFPKEFAEHFLMMRSGQRGPPGGADPRAAGQEMMRQRMMHTPPSQMPRGMQMPSGAQMPAGMQPPGGSPGGPPGKK